MSAIENTTQVEKAFSKQAQAFDAIYREDAIVNYKRQRVREHLEKQLQPNSTILELNAGTGEDAIYLAKKGHRLFCTDVSEEMLAQLDKKIDDEDLFASITSQKCSFLELDTIAHPVKYDHIFSNFGGLNCTDKLDTVLNSFSGLLAKNGSVTLVIMPPFCLWENLLALKGNFKTAFRRYNKNGASSHIEGVHFKSWYYTPDHIINYLKNDFTVTHLEGLCTLVPPSYLKNFPVKFPRSFELLKKAEAKRSVSWPWKNSGDYFIISLKKKN